MIIYSFLRKIDSDSGAIAGSIAGSDPSKCLFLWENGFNFGCFFFLAPGFGGRKVDFKGFKIHLLAKLWLLSHWMLFKRF